MSEWKEFTPSITGGTFKKRTLRQWLLRRPAEFTLQETKGWYKQEGSIIRYQLGGEKPE